MQVKTTGEGSSDTPKRGRPRQVESYAEWMARIDDQVEAQTEKMERKPPTYRWLSSSQKGIVEMLIAHLRSLPEIGPDENCFKKTEYSTVNRVLKELFRAKYPNWSPNREGDWIVGRLPGREGGVYARLLRGCGGRIPVAVREVDRDKED